MSHEDKLTLKGTEVSRFIARMTTKAYFALVAVFIFASVKLILHGNVADYLWLLIGSVLSAAAIFAYSLLAIASKRKSFLLSGVAFAGFIPFLFGCYLVFYRGFWRLSNLFAEFSVWTIVAAVCFVLVGYAVVSGIHKVSEFVGLVDEGKIVLKVGSD